MIPILGTEKLVMSLSDFVMRSTVKEMGISSICDRSARDAHVFCFGVISGCLIMLMLECVGVFRIHL